MAIDPNSHEGVAIRKLTPFNTLPGAYFETLCEEMTVQYAEQGSLLFKRGDETTDLFYLLSGTVELKSDEYVMEEISASTRSSQFALAHQIPRKIDAKAKNDIHYLRIAADLIKQPPVGNFEGESNFMISDEIDENDNDWMTQLLKSPVFQRLPAANLQKILMGFQEISFNKGELVVAQDQPGDYYFFIKSGQCELTRRPAPNAKEITLAKLGINDSFGEDAIISGNPRAGSVTALTDMHLLRIDKDSFISLIRDEVLRSVSYPEIQHQMSNIQVLDVRSPDEYKAQHIENSINIPLFSLRMQLKILNRKKKVIVVCQDGCESGTAVFLLIKNKFNAFVLEGGINTVYDVSNNQAAVFEIEEGQEALPDQESEVLSQSIDQSEAKQVEVETDDNFIIGIDQVKRENQELILENKKLIANYSSLLQEKERLEQDYRILERQTEKLKSVLKKFKVDT
jgi:CRP-like cAMP-binding protein